LNGKALLTFSCLTVFVTQVGEYCRSLPETGYGFVSVMLILSQNSVLNSAIFLRNYVICIA